MQRVTSILPSWDRTKTGSRAGFDKAWKFADNKLGAPVNQRPSPKVVGSETFWPTTLDKESDKAARILRSFCQDGFYAEEEEEDRPTNLEVPKGRQKVIKRIPQRVIQDAVGLAIFTTMRAGLWISGAGGSGVLVARREDGEWSPPSGILVHTASLGFVMGADIYDCVVVINNRNALDALTKPRATLGGEISTVVGPLGRDGGLWKQPNRPIYTYLKSRGFYAGVQVDGTVVIERTDENERFYGQRIGVADIVGGKVRHLPYEIKLLMESLKAAEGRSDVNARLMDRLAQESAPADMELRSPTAPEGPLFGIPEPDDPDPFGVLALEKEGFEIREAGTKSRPPSTQFEYNPSPTSPIYGRFHRRSIDTLASRSNRDSCMSNRTSGRTSIDRSTQTAEMGTQTDGLVTPSTSPSYSDDHTMIIREEDEDRPALVEPADIDYTKIDLGAYGNLNLSQEFDGTTINESPGDHDAPDRVSLSTAYTTDDEDARPEEEEEEEDEEPVIFEAASAQATILTPQAIKARGGLVNIPKRPPPPPLPPRSSARASRVPTQDQSCGSSPVKAEFSPSPVPSPVRSDFSPHLTGTHPHIHNELPSSSSSEALHPKMSVSDGAVSIDSSVDNGHAHPAPKPHFDHCTSGGVPTLASVMAAKGAELRLRVDEEDTFHSLPTTPAAV